MGKILQYVCNVLIGASVGVAVGGAIVAIIGAGVTITTITPYVVVPLLGMSGAQTFAWGALAFDIVTMCVLPFFGIIGDSIEYSEKKEFV